MARFDEGDKRWIVQDHADGNNVHNWHWSRSLLSNLPVLDGEGGLSLRTTSLDKVGGEAYVNVHKGKVIPGYELSIKLAWEGEAKDVAVKVSGLLVGYKD